MATCQYCNKVINSEDLTVYFDELFDEAEIMEFGRAIEEVIEEHYEKERKTISRIKENEQ